MQTGIERSHDSSPGKPLMSLLLPICIEHSIYEILELWTR